MTESEIDDMAEEIKIIIEMNHKLLEFVKFVSVNPPCMTRSIRAKELLKEIGEI